MGRYDAIDVPAAGEGEAFAGELPTVADGAGTQPGWMALSELAPRNETVRSASGAAKAGAFVRTMRLAAGLSQDQLASASGMTQSMISDLERGAGKIGPSFETLLRLAEACGMDIGFVPVGMGASAQQAQGRRMR
jgi:DNA-binding XRE family transcriptional regulator